MILFFSFFFVFFTKGISISGLCLVLQFADE